jgi:hypothetical protein
LQNQRETHDEGVAWRSQQDLASTDAVTTRNHLPTGPKSSYSVINPPQGGRLSGKCRVTIRLEAEMIGTFIARWRDTRSSIKILDQARTAWNLLCVEEFMGHEIQKKLTLTALMKFQSAILAKEYKQKSHSFIFDDLPHFRDPYGNDYNIRMRIRRFGEKIHMTGIEKIYKYVKEEYGESERSMTVGMQMVLMPGHIEINNGPLIASSQMHLGKIAQAFSLPDHVKGWSDLHSEITSSVRRLIVEAISDSSD